MCTFGTNKLRLSVEFNNNRFQHIKIAGYSLYFALKSMSARRGMLIEQCSLSSVQWEWRSFNPLALFSFTLFILFYLSSNKIEFNRWEYSYRS